MLESNAVQLQQVNWRWILEADIFLSHFPCNINCIWGNVFLPQRALYYICHILCFPQCEGTLNTFISCCLIRNLNFVVELLKSVTYLWWSIIPWRIHIWCRKSLIFLAFCIVLKKVVEGQFSPGLRGISIWQIIHPHTSLFYMSVEFSCAFSYIFSVLHNLVFNRLGPAYTF